MKMIISKNPKSARLALAEAAPGVGIAGITNGHWSLIDALRQLLVICGPARITLSTWTAADAHLREAERMLQARNLRELRLIVDRTFPKRQPRYCDLARRLFGDDAIRIWHCHAKFAVVEGEKMTALYISSANLNVNRRIESFNAYFDSDLARYYLDLVDTLYREQVPGTGFDTTAGIREQSKVIFESVR